MTVSSVTLEPIPALKNWYKLTFKSRKDGIGESTVEMLISSESLAWLRNEINRAMPVAEIPEDQKWQLSDAFTQAAKAAENKDK
jgi:hypothetical protein